MRGLGTLGFQRTSNERGGSQAVVITRPGVISVQYESDDLVCFEPSERTNALDFCNGFNAGLSAARRTK